MRDFTQPHPSVPMDGENPCFTCKHATGMGHCEKHNTEVSVFDGCLQHEERANVPHSSEGVGCRPNLVPCIGSSSEFDVPRPDTCPAHVDLSEDQKKWAYGGSIVAQQNFAQLLISASKKLDQLTEEQIEEMLSECVD